MTTYLHVPCKNAITNSATEIMQRWKINTKKCGSNTSIVSSTNMAATSFSFELLGIYCKGHSSLRCPWLKLLRTTQVNPQKIRYSFIFSYFNSEDAMDYYYNFFWDITVLEYLVRILFSSTSHQRGRLSHSLVSGCIRGRDELVCVKYVP